MESRVKIKAGDQVKIKPEWQDAGDDQYEWRALNDEEGGRVKIQPQIPGLAILPNSIAEVGMLEVVPAAQDADSPCQPPGA